MKVSPNTDRREAIADAAITLVAAEGLRSLTHRAIDRALELPAGSTSYYARTRRQLIELMVHRLANRTQADMAAGPASLLDRLAVRAADHRVRYALMVDLAGDPDLHPLLTTASPVRAQFLATAEAALTQAGVADPGRHAPGLIALVDGLLFDRVAGSRVDNADEVIEAYLRGIR
ncbi:TetR/AcrR family transcriptional regulator [Actinoplanes sp. TRM 88003]|uniref:TetR/AcrR family transcriptional regulator n=1 Tax=Paractinoplanes aksuensis TaxID=2939490 RepID=A0ABT1DVQ9_9ACTN|nr:TetR/AcrR family transcriptional regulator [Actinoplanes aksuensis]MCO8274940.1 TetR/AcrR family transcriptional regulator [Actinoplanes aksuensis]